MHRQTVAAKSDYMDVQNINQAIALFLHDHNYPKLSIRAALIDMDGTLYDSMPWHARAWHRMVTELGIKANVNEFFAYEGMTGKATINLLMQRAFGRTVSDAEATELYARKSQYFREEYHPVVMPGAPEMVGTVINHGVTPILVTGSGQASLLGRLSLDFNGAFPDGLRITAHDVVNGKPSPEPYLKGLSLAGVKPWEAVVVENAPLGVKSGVNAGIFTVAVNTGPIPRVEFEKAGAHLIFDSMREFANTLPALLNLS